jgi:hypothetical protein
MLKKYSLIKPIVFGDKTITEIELKELEFGDFMCIKNLQQIGMTEIASMISSVTGLLPPEVKKLGFKDAGFFTNIVTKALEDFQTDES